LRFKFSFIIIFLVCFTNCKKLPKKKLSQWTQKIAYDICNDSLKIEIYNPIKCPIRVFAKSSNKYIQDKLDIDFPVIIPSISDTTYSYWTDKSKKEIYITFTTLMGNPEEEIQKKEMNLPFKNGYTYKIIQGYNGKFSHNSEYSKYSLDFSLKERDTICAAADGVVVGVIEDYKYGGNSKKWRDYANFITVFHPKMNLYTQYVHLMNKGSLVEVGDSIKSEQPIGLSGKTGFTSIEHLHFNVLKANNTGVESFQIDFKEGYKGNELKKGNSVKN
jgi:murein DD-endopeptidase MepM/ murein hydrolase activator NlpD